MVGEDGDSNEPSSKPLSPPRLVVADPRKFSHYVLEPANADGKDHIFINLLGYRPRNAEDAAALSTIYVAQARDRLAEGAYETGSEDKFGRRVTIAIALKGLVLRTGWLLRPDGTLTLATPFAGFVRRIK